MLRDKCKWQQAECVASLNCCLQVAVWAFLSSFHWIFIKSTLNVSPIFKVRGERNHSVVSCETNQ